MPGTITKTGCTLRTYAYDVWGIDGAYLGTFPKGAQDVRFNYAVLGLEDLAPPSVNVLSPDGGETLQAGNSATIGWQVIDEYPSGVRCTILLDLETGSGTTVWMIAQNQPLILGGIGAYNWTIDPGIPGGNTYRIRVIAYDTNNHEGVDVSNGYFTIEPWTGKGGPPPPPPPCEYPCTVPGRPPIYVTDLLPVSPNPFNPGTRLRFTLARSDEVALRVYDVRGKLITTVVDGVRTQGLHEIPWDGSDASGRSLPSGVYFVALSVDRRVFTQKLVILR